MKTVRCLLGILKNFHSLHRLSNFEKGKMEMRSHHSLSFGNNRRSSEQKHRNSFKKHCDNEAVINFVASLAPAIKLHYVNRQGNR